VGFGLRGGMCGDVSSGRPLATAWTRVSRHLAVEWMLHWIYTGWVPLRIITAYVRLMVLEFVHCCSWLGGHDPRGFCSFRFSGFHCESWESCRSASTSRHLPFVPTGHPFASASSQGAAHFPRPWDSCARDTTMGVAICGCVGAYGACFWGLYHVRSLF
jgi:hypothetical protein